MNDFFAGIHQQPLQIRDVTAKAPMFFRDLQMMFAVVTVDRTAAAALLPKGLEPLVILPGRAIAAIHCFEYRDTDIGPYNEVSIALGIRDSLPGPLSAARSVLARRYRAFIVDLPVNTEPALHGGIDIFGYPKFLADIAFKETDDWRTCTVADRETGAPLWTLRGRRLKTRKTASVAEYLSYPIRGGQRLEARFRLNELEGATSHCHCAFQLELGEHLRSAQLRDLRIGRVLRYGFAPKAQAILYEPRVN